MDRHWFGGLESSGWLAMVRASLVAAKEVTHMLCIRRHGVMLFGKGSTLIRTLAHTCLYWQRRVAVISVVWCLLWLN